MPRRRGLPARSIPSCCFRLTGSDVHAATFFDVVAGTLRGRTFRFEDPRFMCMPHAWTTHY
jgi:hypothetical protein